MPALVALLVGAILLSLPGFARCQTVPQAVLDLQACEKEYQADVREQQDRLAGFNECSRRALDKTTRPPLTEEEMKAMRQKQEDAQRFEQTVRGRLAALRDSDVTLEFSSCCAGFNYIFHGCVIGKGGSVYLYDEKFNFSNSGQLTAEEYNKASELATKLTNKVLAARRIGFDAAKAQWSVHRNGVGNELKVMGDIEGERDEPAARELVDLINAWCPSARSTIESRKRIRTIQERFGSELQKE